MEVSPVLPPSATPEEDSTNVVTVLVPSIAPVAVVVAAAVGDRPPEVALHVVDAIEVAIRVEESQQDVLHDVFRIGLRSRAEIGEAVKGILSPIDDPLEEFQFRFLHILSVLTTRLFIRRTRCEKDLTEA